MLLPCMIDGTIESVRSVSCFHDRRYHRVHCIIVSSYRIVSYHRIEGIIESHAVVRSGLQLVSIKIFRVAGVTQFCGAWTVVKTFQSTVTLPVSRKTNSATFSEGREVTPGRPRSWSNLAALVNLYLTAGMPVDLQTTLLRNYSLVHGEVCETQLE